MPGWLLDPNVQGLIALMFVAVGGFFAFIKWVKPAKKEEPITKLEVSFPNDTIEERLIRLEALCFQIFHKVHEDLEEMDELGLLARHLLDRAKLPDAKVHALGMEIKASVEELANVIRVSNDDMREMLSALEEQGLIDASANDSVVLFGTNA